MQIIFQEKILPWGLMALRESDLNGYCPKGVLVTFLEESRIWRGREGKWPTGACPLYYLSFFFPQFPLFSSLFSFLSFFLFSFTLFSFYSVNTLFFDLFFRAWQGSFYSARRGQFFTTLPLNRLCLVWAYLPTTKSVRHSPLPDKGRFVSFLSLP